MALTFPTSSASGDIYQSGSSAVYQYDGEKWVVRTNNESQGATSRIPKSGATWAIAHNLNTATPVVEIYSGSNIVIPQSVQIDDNNNLTVLFPESVTGTAVVSTGVGAPTSASYALNTSNSVSASYASTATSASYATTAQPVDNLTYNGVVKTTTQTLISGTTTTITNWTSHIININSTGWSGADGIYTAPKAGVFRVSGAIQVAANQVSINSEFSLILHKNAVVGGLSIIGQARWFSPVVGNPVFPTSMHASAVTTLAPGDQVFLGVYHALGGNRGLHTSGNYFEIQQIANL